MSHGIEYVWREKDYHCSQCGKLIGPMRFRSWGKNYCSAACLGKASEPQESFETEIPHKVEVHEYVYRAGAFGNLESTVLEPVKVLATRQKCACGQEIPERTRKVWVSPVVCADCFSRPLMPQSPPYGLSLDDRIAAAQVKRDPDPVSEWSAWSHPSAEGEDWR